MGLREGDGLGDAATKHPVLRQVFVRAVCAVLGAGREHLHPWADGSEGRSGRAGTGAVS